MNKDEVFDFLPPFEAGIELHEDGDESGRSIIFNTAVFEQFKYVLNILVFHQ